MASEKIITMMNAAYVWLRVTSAGAYCSKRIRSIENITFSFFSPDLVQVQPIHGYMMITTYGWVIAY